MKAAQIVGPHIVFQMAGPYLHTFLHVKPVVSYFASRNKDGERRHRYQEIRNMRNWTYNSEESRFTVSFSLEGDSYNRDRYFLDNENTITLPSLPTLHEYDLRIDDLRIDGSDDKYWYHPEGFLTGGKMTRTRK